MNLFKSAVLSMIIRGSGILCLTGLLLMVSKHLSVEDYGRIEILLALAQLFSVLALFGFNRATLKFVPAYVKNDEVEKVSGLLLCGYALCLFISLILFLLFFVFKVFFSESSAIDLALMALIFSPLLGFTILNMETLRAGGSVASALSGYLLFRHLVALAITAVGIQFYELSVLWVLSAIFAGLVSLFIWDLFRLLKLTSGALPSFRLREWTRTSFPMLITQTSLVLTSKGDLLMIGAVLGLKEAALYALAKRIANLIGFFKLSISSVWSPKFSLAFHQGEFAKLQSLANTSWLAVFLPTLVVVVAVCVLLGQILNLYLPHMSETMNAALILVFGQLIVSFFGLPGIMLNMFDGQDYVAKVTLLTGLASILLIAPASYLGGIEHVAVVVSTAKVLNVAIASWACRKKYGISSVGLFGSQQGDSM